MKIYMLCIDDNVGTTVSAFLSREGLDKAAREWCAANWDEDFFGRPMPERWEDAWADEATGEGLCEGDAGWIVVEEQELDDSATWHALKAANPGSFGVLYDPAEILTMMDGWDEEYGFDSENPEDVEAITAWCEEEAADFEDIMSTLVGDNAPTVSEAYGALERKRAKSAA